MFNRLTTSIALACVCTGAHAQNLMSNGSFETPGPGFVLFQDWQNFGNVFADIGGVEVPAQEGMASCKMFGSSIGTQSDQVLLQTVPGINAGELYTLSGFVWENSADPLGDENIIILQMNFQDAGGTTLETVEVNMFDPMSDPSDEWIPGSVSGIAPAGTSQILVAVLHIQLGADQGFPTQGGGASFWDNIQLVAGDAPCNNPADFDGNGELDFFDISAFLNAFAEGCPE